MRIWRWTKRHGNGEGDWTDCKTYVILYLCNVSIVQINIYKLQNYLLKMLKKLLLPLHV